MSELKPCPFCGESETLDVMGGLVERYVACGQCDADGPIRKSDQDCISLWNARAKPGIPWRKVSEKPTGTRDIVTWSGTRIVMFQWHRFRVFAVNETHWCYLDELKPEDTE